jgi:hypothetical protein
MSEQEKPISLGDSYKSTDDADELQVGDWVMQRNRPELGLAVVTSVTYYQSGSGLWQVVNTDEPTWRGTLSQCLIKVGPPKSWRKR